MSMIALVVTDPGTQRSNVIAAIRHATGLPLSAIVKAIDGRQAVVERELFYRDHDEVAGILRSLLSVLPATGASFEVYELPKGTHFSASAETSAHRISTEVLQRILLGHEEGLREQQESVDRELEERED